MKFGLVEGEIDITGLDLAEVLVALHRGTRALGMGVLHDHLGLDVEAARTMVEYEGNWRNGRLMFDYINGRPIKVWFEKRDQRVVLTRAPVYDRDAGAGACLRVIRKLRMLNPPIGCDPRCPLITEYHDHEP